jgi:hypothetical protein
MFPPNGVFDFLEASFLYQHGLTSFVLPRGSKKSKNPSPARGMGSAYSFI